MVAFLVLRKNRTFHYLLILELYGEKKKWVQFYANSLALLHQNCFFLYKQKILPIGIEMYEKKTFYYF